MYVLKGHGLGRGAGLGDAADHCTLITQNMQEMLFCVNAFNSGVPFTSRQSVLAAMGGSGSGGSQTPFSQPPTFPGQQASGTMFPTIPNPFAPSPMMPGLQPGMPGYMPPQTQWWQGTMGIVALGIAALIGYKVLTK